MWVNSAAMILRVFSKSSSASQCGLTPRRPSMRRLCSRRKMVWMAVRPGCSEARPSPVRFKYYEIREDSPSFYNDNKELSIIILPAIKQNPLAALHSGWLSERGSKSLPPWMGLAVAFRRPLNPRSLRTMHGFSPYTTDASMNAVFWFTCSRGPKS